MSLYAETYAVVSYEEMMEAERQVEESAKKYKQVYKNFLITCLCEAGFAKKIVRHKELNIVGVLEVSENSYHSWRPYDIKFFPMRKDGVASQKSKFYGLTHDRRLVQDLTEMFELVGDENAG